MSSLKEKRLLNREEVKREVERTLLLKMKIEEQNCKYGEIYECLKVEELI